MKEKFGMLDAYKNIHVLKRFQNQYLHKRRDKLKKHYEKSKLGLTSTCCAWPLAPLTTL
jgi:hypothetical protein